MAVGDVTYNSLLLPNQMSKVRMEQTSKQVRFTATFAIAPSALDATLATLRDYDKSLTVLDKTYSITTNAISLRTTVEKQGSDLDSVGRQRLTFSVIVRLIDEKVGDDGIEEFSADCFENAQGRKEIIVKGSVTYNASGSATTNFDDNIATLEATFRTLFGGTYNPPSRVQGENDRHDNFLAFSSRQIELLELVNVYDGSETLNPGVIFTRWNHRRSRVLDKGHNDPNVEIISVSFECEFIQGFATGRATLQTDIAALVIKRLFEQFNADAVVLINEDEGFSSTEQGAAATWLFRIDNGPQFLSFSEVIADELLYGSTRKVQDRQALTAVVASPGASMVLIQTVVATFAGAPPGDPPPPAISIPDAVLIPLRRRRDRGESTQGADIGRDSFAGNTQEVHTLTYVKTWQIVIPSAFDPKQTEVKPVAPA